MTYWWIIVVFMDLFVVAFKWITFSIELWLLVVSVLFKFDDFDDFNDFDDFDDFDTGPMYLANSIWSILAESFKDSACSNESLRKFDKNNKLWSFNCDEISIADKFWFDKACAWWVLCFGLIAITTQQKIILKKMTVEQNLLENISNTVIK